MSETGGLNMNVEIVKWMVIGIGIILVFIFLLLAMGKGWLKNFKAGRDGISFEQEKKKKVKSGHLNKMMDDNINKCDEWTKDQATKLADNLRRCLRRFLDPFIQYPSGRRSVSGAIRSPLYNAVRANEFKIKLRPENIEAYLDGLMEKIRAEYEDVDDEQVKFVCPIHRTDCIQFPKFDELTSGLREQIKKYWLLPLKDYQIEMHRKKIEIFKKNISIFQDIEDDDRVDICKFCIKKNEGYIDALLNGKSHAVEQGYEIAQ
jgi:hypothetical protein